MVMKFTILTMFQTQKKLKTEKNSRTFPEYLIYFVKKVSMSRTFQGQKKIKKNPRI